MIWVPWWRNHRATGHLGQIWPTLMMSTRRITLASFRRSAKKPCRQQQGYQKWIAKMGKSMTRVKKTQDGHRSWQPRPGPCRCLNLPQSMLLQAMPNAKSRATPAPLPTCGSLRRPIRRSMLKHGWAIAVGSWRRVRTCAFGLPLFAPETVKLRFVLSVSNHVATITESASTRARFLAPIATNPHASMGDSALAKTLDATFAILTQMATVSRMRLTCRNTSSIPGAAHGHHGHDPALDRTVRRQASTWQSLQHTACRQSLVSWWWHDFNSRKKTVLWPSGRREAVRFGVSQNGGSPRPWVSVLKWSKFGWFWATTILGNMPGFWTAIGWASDVFFPTEATAASQTVLRCAGADMCLGDPQGGDPKGAIVGISCGNWCHRWHPNSSPVLRGFQPSKWIHMVGLWMSMAVCHIHGISWG